MHVYIFFERERLRRDRRERVTEQNRKDIVYKDLKERSINLWHTDLTSSSLLGLCVERFIHHKIVHNLTNRHTREKKIGLLRIYSIHLLCI